MRLSRWQPLGSLWRELQQLQGEMNRAFERWDEDGARLLGLTAVFPACNVWEDGDRVFVEAELPGLEQGDLEIHVTGGNQLTIKGERKQPAVDEGVWHRQERGFGAFSRSLTLPFAVDTDKVDARFENGVLLVELTKHASALPRKIPIKSQ